MTITKQNAIERHKSDRNGRTCPGTILWNGSCRFRGLCYQSRQSKSDTNYNSVSSIYQFSQLPKLFFYLKTVLFYLQIEGAFSHDCLGNGKRSIALNLKTEQGAEILKKLTSKSDVIIDPFRRGLYKIKIIQYIHRSQRKRNSKN